jgi:serine/threonine protein kinase
MICPTMDTMFGRYRILGKLGEGGMACVYMAEDPTLRRAVALKVMRESMATSADWARRFHQEATTVARLCHNQIVQVHDSGTQDGSEFLVMEFQDRGSFGKILQTHGKLDPVLATCVVQQAAEGLAAAHEAGVVHRDVKPDNILLSRQGVAKVADFGIARIQNDVSHTQAGTAMGSPQFMAPEQIEGGELSGKTDVFALGGVLYKAVSGEHPFEAEHLHGTMWRITSQEPRELRALVPSCSRTLSDLVKAMHAKQPAKRPSMEEVVQRLRTWLAEQGVLSASEHLRSSLGFPAANALSGSTTTSLSRPRRRGLSGFLDRLRRAMKALASSD